MSNKTIKFIEKAKAKHNDLYSYDETSYENIRTPVTIICSIHGRFSQTPDKHLRGRGCRKCADAEKRKSSDDYIQGFNKFHNNAYEYPNMKEWKNCKDKIPIWCPKHEHTFFQRIDQHLTRMASCEYCKKENKYKKLQNAFIEKSKQLYPNRYGYGDVEYKSEEDKVILECLMHNVKFIQSPRVHFRGHHGCLKCQQLSEYNTRACISSNDLFKLVKDGYTIDIQPNITLFANSIVCVYCTIHNKYGKQKVSKITLGQKLRCCSLCELAQNKMVTREYITDKCSIKHNNVYDYSLFPQKLHMTKKYDVICKLHGRFHQRLNSHLSGCGCPICRFSHMEREVTRVLSSLDITYIPQYENETCKWKNTLKFDFYIPDMNMIIEVDGQQHFEYCDFFHKSSHNYYKHILKDIKKNIWCLSNNITVVRISYDCNVEVFFKSIVNKVDKIDIILSNEELYRNVYSQAMRYYCCKITDS